MKTTLEEMAYGYACNRLVPDAQCDNSAEITNLHVMFADFAKKVLEERERWRDPEKELPEDGAIMLVKTTFRPFRGYPRNGRHRLRRRTAP